MNRKEAIPVIGVSLLLLIYAVLILLQIWLPVVYIIYITSPICVIWLVYNVIRYGEYKSRELEKDEEWGYADKDTPRSIVRDVFYNVKRRGTKNLKSPRNLLQENINVN